MNTHIGWAWVAKVTGNKVLSVPDCRRSSGLPPKPDPCSASAKCAPSGVFASVSDSVTGPLSLAKSISWVLYPGHKSPRFCTNGSA